VPENETLQLLTPAPEERLLGWLAEFYGKPVSIVGRELLRHRDLSMVERLYVDNALPASLIYKLVLPPWDVEQDLHERVLIPSISNSATLFMSAHYGQMAALFLEDLGTHSLLGSNADADLASAVGKELAKLHRAYSYRIDELMQVNVLRSLVPIDYEHFAERLLGRLLSWRIIEKDDARLIAKLAGILASKLAGEPISLVHGDLYAENILIRNDRLFIIDWSWFTIVGVPAMDLATLTMNHFKNGDFYNHRDTVLDAYCFESGRQLEDVAASLPYAETLSRLYFLNWLVERRNRGILGTTVGPVEGVIVGVMNELKERLAKLTES
jgi:thiamine kinase-like enzyme